MRPAAEGRQQFEQAVRAQHPGLLENLPEHTKDQLLEVLSAFRRGAGETEGEGSTVAQAMSLSSYRGPVPPAELLEGYNNAFPDGANRLFTLVENQSAHRQSLELSAVYAQNALSSRGQIFAFVLALAFGGSATWLAASGHPELSATIFGGTITALAGTFIWGQKAQARSLDRKKPLADRKVQVAKNPELKTGQAP